MRVKNKKPAYHLGVKKFTRTKKFISHGNANRFERNKKLPLPFRIKKSPLPFQNSEIVLSTN